MSSDEQSLDFNLDWIHEGIVPLFDARMWGLGTPSAERVQG